MAVFESGRPYANSGRVNDRENLSAMRPTCGARPEGQVVFLVLQGAILPGAPARVRFTRQSLKERRAARGQVWIPFRRSRTTGAADRKPWAREKATLEYSTLKNGQKRLRRAVSALRFLARLVPTRGDLCKGGKKE